MWGRWFKSTRSHHSYSATYVTGRVPVFCWKCGVSVLGPSLVEVVDLYSRRVAGWAMDRRMKKALPIRALVMAINLGKSLPGVIHHPTSGSQYTSYTCQALLEQRGMVCSMSRNGNCIEYCPGRTVNQQRETGIERFSFVSNTAGSHCRCGNRCRFIAIQGVCIRRRVRGHR
jgi:transposase InsO family protein